LGATIKSPGYNIFVTGIPGTGRLSLVEQVLKEVQKHKEYKADDFLYVHNFKNPGF
jgi:Cdc6-like AAA superfamily ATPase